MVIKLKQSKNCIHLTKTETSLVIWLNIVAIVARSVHILPTHARRRGVMPLANCIVNDGLVNVMPNMQKITTIYLNLSKLCPKYCRSLLFPDTVYVGNGAKYD